MNAEEKIERIHQILGEDDDPEETITRIRAVLYGEPPEPPTEDDEPK